MGETKLWPWLGKGDREGLRLDRTDRVGLRYKTFPPLPCTHTQYGADKKSDRSRADRRIFSDFGVLSHRDGGKGTKPAACIECIRRR